MPKCTVTVNQSNNVLVHPSSESFATANDLVTLSGNNSLYNILPENAVRSLKLTCKDDDDKEYQVKLSVSITKIGEGDDVELIPQINLSIVGEE
jgi:hypothetical protein